jgi:hypothetical protein
MAAVVTVNDIALPTHFVQVTAAHVSATENKINWKVTDETNVDYYQVERSTNCNYFESIGKVAYQLSTQNTNQYQFIDGSAPASDKTCYQIKQVDIGGKALYSTIVSISVPSEKTFQVWPNPAEDKVMIEYFSERKVVAEVSLFDLNGRKMMSKPMLLQVGSNAFALDQLKKLASGSYFIRINSGAEILFNKLIIK